MVKKKNEIGVYKEKKKSVEVESLYGCCCGIDVHSMIIMACLRTGNKNEVREYKAFTSSLYEMTAWLKSTGCEMVAMESTGSYWKPLMNIFEEEGLSSIVVNAQHMKTVPGRKTDVTDAQWIAQLLQQGLLSASYIPDRDQRELRDLIRYRKSIIEERTRETNRLIKILQGANIKLKETISDINGVTAQRLLSLIRTGEKIDLDKVIACKTGNIAAKPEELLMAMEGYCTDLQKDLIDEIIDNIKSINARIKRLEALLDKHMADPFVEAAKRLEVIPGIGNDSARTIVAEIGIDMSKFPSAKHLSSWSGLSPGNRQSAGKRYSGKTCKANKTLKSTMVQCSNAAVRNKESYYSAQYARLVRTKGHKKAVVAVAHSIMIAVYYVLCGESFKDLGADFYNNYNRDKKLNSHINQLRKLGFTKEELIEKLEVSNLEFKVKTA